MLSIFIYDSLQGSRCHPKFIEAANKVAKQLAKYEGAASPALLVTEGSSSPELEGIGLHGETRTPLQEVADYNADYQVPFLSIKNSYA